MATLPTAVSEPAVRDVAVRQTAPVVGWGRLVGREWVKLTRRRAGIIWLTVALLGAVALGLWGAGDMYRQYVYANNLEALARRMGISAAALRAGRAADPHNRALAALLGWPRAASYALLGANNIGPFLIAAAAAGLVADEYRTGTIRLVWTEGVPRSKVLAAKVIALAGLVLAAMVVVAAFGLGGAALLHPLQHVPWIRAGVPAAALADQVALTLLGNLLFAGLGAVVAVVTRSRLWGTLAVIGWLFAESAIVVRLLGGSGAFLPLKAFLTWRSAAFAGVHGGMFLEPANATAGSSPLVVTAWAVALWVAAALLGSRQEARAASE